MKKFLILAFVLATVSGCSTARKQFVVVVDPPDAEIRVIPGGGRSERIYKSPALVSFDILKDPAETAKNRIEISRSEYKTRVIGFNEIQEGKPLKITLEKTVLYSLKFRMVGPRDSDNLSYRDPVAAFSIVPGERQFEMTIENLTEKPLKILWDRSEYIDYKNSHHPLMHNGVKPANRNDIIQPQLIPARASLRVAFFPKSSVAYSQVVKDYVMKPLFPLETEAALSLKGRTVNVFLPLEVDRSIIPDYNFRFEIVDVVKN